jgi:hypothetical protein
MRNDQQRQFCDDLFWRLYEERARQPIERACRGASRRLGDGLMDIDDMVSWVDQRVWRMQSKQAWPIFHDEPSEREAVERVLGHVLTLSRWAYLALMRQHWRRMEREGRVAGELTRTEKLAMTRAEPEAFEKHEETAAKLDELRSKLDEKLRVKLAASWAQPEERKRIAMALGVTSDEDDALIDEVTFGDVKRNTVEQMRSRSLRRSREVMRASKKALMIAAFIGALFAFGADARANGGEQTGGRGGKAISAPTVQSGLVAGEMTGGPIGFGRP